MVSVLVVASNTRKFLGAARGTAQKTAELQIKTQLRSRCLLLILSGLLTCFSVAVHWGPVSIHIHCLDLDGVGGVRDQVVQEGVVGVPGNHDLHKQKG